MLLLQTVQDDINIMMVQFVLSQVLKSMLFVLIYHRTKINKVLLILLMMFVKYTIKKVTYLKHKQMIDTMLQ